VRSVVATTHITRAVIHSQSVNSEEQKNVKTLVKDGYSTDCGDENLRSSSKWPRPLGDFVAYGARQYTLLRAVQCAVHECGLIQMHDNQITAPIMITSTQVALSSSGNCNVYLLLQVISNQLVHSGDICDLHPTECMNRLISQFQCLDHAS
jgi:hypothetical protein